MKRFVVLTLTFFFALTSVFAEPAKLNRKQREARDIYSKARLLSDNKIKLQQLKEAIALDPTFEECYWLISSTYKEMGDDKSSIIYLERAAKPQYRNYNKTCFRLGKAYFNTGDYVAAKSWFQKVPGKYTDWERRCDEAQVLKSNPVPFQPQNLTKVNTDFDDYWPSITADGKRISITVLVGQREGKRDFTAQEDIYQSVYDDTTQTWSKSESIGNPTNTAQNEGSQNYSVDGRYMFFVACDRASSVGGCDVYYSIRRGNTWSPPINCGRPLNTQYWESTPSFSPAGDEIFFSSNRPGGLGGQDIWASKVRILESGQLQFSEPRNLGAPINTAEDDFCPFISADNKTLYFSSKGHPGLGGYDIFVIKRDENGKWGSPRNIGYPINTHMDEIGFCVNAQGDKAYLSSNGILKNGRGKDIYEIELPSEIRPEPMEFFNGKVWDAKTHRPIQAHIEVFRLSDDKTVFSSVSDEVSGQFQAFLPEDQDYGYNITKKGYLFESGTVKKGENIKGANVQVNVQPIAIGGSATLNNIFFDFDKATLQQQSFAQLGRLATFLKQNSKVTICVAGHTDSKGSRTYNIDLSLRRAKSVAEYLIKHGIDPARIDTKGYGPDKPVADNDTDEGRAKNRRVEFIITKD
jgi:outer membrane protein OmpA-like peptidoglycan-associated protein